LPLCFARRLIRIQFWGQKRISGFVKYGSSQDKPFVRVLDIRRLTLTKRSNYGENRQGFECFN